MVNLIVYHIVLFCSVFRSGLLQWGDLGSVKNWVKASIMSVAMSNFVIYFSFWKIRLNISCESSADR